MIARGQDHPDDRAWLKHVYDFVCPDGSLPKDKVGDLLGFFYRRRPEGPTQSGSYLHTYPESEKNFILGLYPDGVESIEFPTLMNALMDAQGPCAPPRLCERAVRVCPYVAERRTVARGDSH